MVGGRVDFGPRLPGVEGLGRPAVGASGLHHLREVLGLVRSGGERKLARLLEAGIDRMTRDRVLDRREVLAREALQLRHLVRPARHAVLDAVRERGRHEAAVAARGAEGDPLALEQHHLALGIFLAREESRPEPGQPATDDHQVSPVLAPKRWAWLRRIGLVEPERPRQGVGVGAADGGGVHGRSLRWTSREGWQSGRMRRS